MKCGVETRNLRQVGITVSERLDQVDLARQVIWVARANLAQFLNQLGRDAFGLMVTSPAMNDTVPNGGDCRETDCMIEPIDQQVDGCLLIRGVDLSILPATAAGMDNDPTSIL
jgi:hypothetical protein